MQIKSLNLFVTANIDGRREDNDKEKEDRGMLPYRVHSLSVFTQQG